MLNWISLNFLFLEMSKVKYANSMISQTFLTINGSLGFEFKFHIRRKPHEIQIMSKIWNELEVFFLIESRKSNVYNPLHMHKTKLVFVNIKSIYRLNLYFSHNITNDRIVYHFKLMYSIKLTKLYTNHRSFIRFEARIYTISVYGNHFTGTKASFGK